MTTPIAMDKEAVKTRCYEIIDSFYHREALRDDDVRSWVREVVDVHGEAAIWHASRAKGFGGSDIGILVRNFSGHRADHQASAHDIVASKLLKILPSEDSGDLRRGHDNEPLHAQKYYAKYSATRDTAAFDLLTNSQGLRNWMRYSPDDVILMPANQPNPELGGLYARRLLIDYKAPRRVEDDDSIAFQYACQLHQGAMICAKAGIHLDGLQLSQYDWANWKLKDDYVPYDPDISKLILQAGDYYFGYVMRGELPRYIFTPKFEKENEFVSKFGKIAQRLAHIAAAGDAFVFEAEALKAEIKAHFKNERLAGKKLQLGDLTVTAVKMINHEKMQELLTKEEISTLRNKSSTPNYDTNAMVLKLKELGVDVKQYRIDKVDGDLAYPILIENGFDPEQFIDEQIRFKVSNQLKDAAKQLVAISFPKHVEEVIEIEDTQLQLENDAQVDQVIENDVSGIQLIDQNEENVREGQIAERLSQRTAMA